MKVYGVIAFFVGFAALTVVLYLTMNYFPADSWLPTLLYVPALLLVLFGQMLVLTLLMEDSGSGFAWLKLSMFGFVSVLPLLATYSIASTTGHHFMTWSAVVLLVIESALFLFSVVSFPSDSGPARSPATH